MNNLFLALKAALKAGEKILTIYNDPNSDFGIERKEDNSPLTIADKKAHEAIVEILEQSNIYILSEEGGKDNYTERKKHSTIWIIDPLDGTKEFIKRNGDFTVNIALITDGVPVMGVVYLPTKQTLYFASKQIGSYRLDNINYNNNFSSAQDFIDASLRLPIFHSKECYTIVASRSHLSPETEDFITQAEQQYSNVQRVTRGSSIKIALVAEGSADVYPRFAPTMEWDTAAGDAVARYAGAEVIDSQTQQDLIYNKENLLNPWFIVRRK